MCGISGIYSHKYFDRNTIDIMANSLNHRGPDDQGLNLKRPFYSGFRRLSIVDIEGGHQPLYNLDKSICLIANGEIYNYQDLKKSHVSSYSFQTKSDSEIILALYAKYGVDSFEMLNGMFAFALMDYNRNELYLVRDRFGQKPLYYFQKDDVLFFSSEVKSFLSLDFFKKKVNREALPFYFYFNFVPGEETLIASVKKVRPGYFIKVFADLKVTQTKYSSSIQKKFVESKSWLNNIEKIDKVLTDSVSRHLMSDVPIALFLSGGLDSTLILKKVLDIGKTIQCFSIDFKNGGDTPFIHQVSKVYKMPCEIISIEPSIEEVVQILQSYADPLGDSANVPASILSRVVSQKYKVVLTGEGGDEVFGGYPRYQDCLNHLNDNLNDRYWKQLAFTRCVDLANGFKMDLAQLKDYFSSFKLKSISDLLLLEQKQRLADNLFLKMDTATMANSLEGRCPLLDNELVDLMNFLPIEYKVSKSGLKISLKELLRNDFNDLFLNRSKLGFGSPLKNWIKRSDWHNYIGESFRRNSDILDLILKPHFKSEFLKNFEACQTNEQAFNYNHWKIFTLIVWTEKYQIDWAA